MKISSFEIPGEVLDTLGNMRYHLFEIPGFEIPGEDIIF